MAQTCISSDEKFRCLADTMPSALFVHRGERFIYANAAADRMIGVTRRELLEMNFWEIVRPADRETWTKRGRARLAGGEEPRSYEFVLTARDDTAHWCECHAARIEFDGAPAILLTATDITDRKRAEQALREAHDELELRVAQRTEELTHAQTQLLQSEKLASIGQLAAGVAHEINNPIGYVQSNLGTLGRYIDELFGALGAYAELEKRCAADTAVAGELRALRTGADLAYLAEDIPQLLKETAEGITRVRQIVADLKDFSRVDSAQQREWADLHACLESTLNIAHNEIKYCATVEREYGDLPPVHCIPSQLNQVFLNLLVNAAHAIEQAPGTITVRTARHGDEVCIEIRDTGKGMSAEVQSKIFDPFFTTKPVGKGTGLGLSLAYGIVEKHRGRIEVESRVGVGTTFRIRLPIGHDEAEEHADEPAEGEVMA